MCTPVLTVNANYLLRSWYLDSYRGDIPDTHPCQTRRACNCVQLGLGKSKRLWPLVHASKLIEYIQNFLLAFFTPFIVSAINFSYGFVFAGCNLLGAIVVWAFLYESAGLSLENVDIMYKSPMVKPWTSSRWAPPGYASRAAAVEEKRERTAKSSGGMASGHGAHTSYRKDGKNVRPWLSLPNTPRKLKSQSSSGRSFSL